MYQNRIVEKIYKIHEEYSRSFNHDLKTLFADLQKQQSEKDRKIVDLLQPNKMLELKKGKT